MFGQKKSDEGQERFSLAFALIKEFLEKRKVAEKNENATSALIIRSQAEGAYSLWFSMASRIEVDRYSSELIGMLGRKL